MELEQNQLTVRIRAPREYARINRLNRIAVRSSDDRIGIVAAGKTYLDVREALRLIGLGDEELNRAGHPDPQDGHGLPVRAADHARVRRRPR